MSNNWKSRPFADCAELVREIYLPDPKEKLPFIGMEHIEKQTLRLLGIGESSEVVSAKSRFKAGDILFGKLNPHFRKVIRPKFDGICSTDIMVIRAKDGIDQGFLFYWIASPQFIDAVSKASEGTGLPRAKWDFMAKIEKAIPSTAEQNAIGKFLGVFDEKIELIDQMNVTLAEMADALFRQWFVEFDFPDEEGGGYKSNGGVMADSELGDIPDGWEVKPFGEVASMIRGFSYSGKEKDVSSGDYVFITLNNIKEGGGFKPEFSWINSGRLKDRHFLSEGDLIIANTHFGVGGTNVARLLGCPALVFFPYYYQKSVGVFSHHITKTIPYNEDMKYFLYLFLKMTHKETASGYHTGTSVAGLDTDNFLKNRLIVVPPAGIISKFNSLVKPLLNQIALNHKEIPALMQMRDMHLPHLMKGDIDVGVLL